MELTRFEQGLLDHYQHFFPLTDRPFDNIAREFGISEPQVLRQIESLMMNGVVSRIGPVFSADSVGASTLAVMSVPQAELVRIANLISGFDEVTHNYERKHLFNLWFVVSSHSEKALQLVLSVIEKRAGFNLISLPMLHDYQVDLGCRLNTGFPLKLKSKNVVSLKAYRQLEAGKRATTEIEQKVIQRIQSGVPICESPYDILGECLNMTGREVMGVIQRLHHDGVISRWGVVLRHYELGFEANAMVVWDIPNDKLDDIAAKIAEENTVSMCYKRPRSLPDWRFNLFSQIHGESESSINEAVEVMADRFGQREIVHNVLFSSKRFKHLGSKLRPVTTNVLLASPGGLKS